MLETTRLQLRPPTEADDRQLFGIHGDPRANVHNPLGPHADLKQSRSLLAGWIAHWQQHGFGTWAITTLQDPGTIIGFGGIAFRNYVDEEKLNLGYRFAPTAWGLGYATELGRAALRYAFEQHGLADVYAIVRPLNTASARVLEKLPMQRIGHLDDVPGQPMSLLYWAGRPDHLAG